jgi:hypothetical protein
MPPRVFIAVLRSPQSHQVPARVLNAARARAAGLLAEWGPEYRPSLDAWRERILSYGVNPHAPREGDWAAPVPKDVYPKIEVFVVFVHSTSGRRWQVHWSILFEPPAGARAK